MSEAARAPTSTAVDSRPIGVFDSGVGGLTVLAALMTALPQERFVYLGDTARLPYGSKPLEMVMGFADEIAAELQERGVKAIVIACNTASAASLPGLAERCAVPVWGVVEPGVAAALAAAPAPGTVGVLGTAATVEARVYQRRLEVAGAGTWARACPLFVPLVEEGLQDSVIGGLVIDHYLADRPPLDALILGCTHYPLLKPALSRALGEELALIDSSEAVAAFVAAELGSLGLLTAAPAASPAAPIAAQRVPPAHAPHRLEYLVTGDVDVFLHTAARLGGPPAPAERVTLRPVRQPIAGGSRSRLAVLDAATTEAA